MQKLPNVDKSDCKRRLMCLVCQILSTSPYDLAKWFQYWKVLDIQDIIKSEEYGTAEADELVTAVMHLGTLGPIAPSPPDREYR